MSNSVQLKHVLKQGSTHPFYSTQVFLGIISVLITACIGKLIQREKEREKKRKLRDDLMKSTRRLGFVQMLLDYYYYSSTNLNRILHLSSIILPIFLFLINLIFVIFLFKF